jgi:nucleoid DNA-binding protein
MKINKDYLVNYVTKSLKSEFSKDDVKFITDKIFEVIANSLSEGNRIEIRGFGSFSLRDRMVPKDPRDNKSSNSDRIKCSSVYFRMSKNMSDQIKDI